jgi:hypothetical protein
MNSLNFTRTPLSKRKPVNYGTNNMGKYYKNERVPISPKQINTVIPEKFKNCISLLNDSYNENEQKSTIQNNIINIYDIIQSNKPKPDDKEETFKGDPYTKKEIFYIVTLIKSRKLIIENVYQNRYNNMINSTGLGDFIRGSYFVMQFCKEYNLPFNINLLNHPISQFLDVYKNKQPFIYENINKFDNINFHHCIKDDIITNIYDDTTNNDFINYLVKQNSFNNKIKIYVITYPNTIIENGHKAYMKQLLNPTYNLSLFINDTLTKLSLVKNNYTVIHIRLGDTYLIHSEENVASNYLEQIEKRLTELNSRNQYLLISDNNAIKQILITKYPFIKTHFEEITHTGEGVLVDSVKLKNTMVDFYLISHAVKIIAFSVYNHGTGFSKWCAETYNIPYVCWFINK